MCWNQEVSLNTFLFSTFVLGLIIYNNTYTQYKIQEINNIWVYLFFFAFILMQLFEFFIWRNIDNKYYNSFFSKGATLLITSQPIFSLMILSNIPLRNILLGVYLLLAIPFIIYKFFTKDIHSEVSKSGHLRWIFFETTPIHWIIYLFFLLFTFFYNKTILGLFFAFITLSFSFYNYLQDRTIGSMWCWIINIVMVYYAIYLLIYLPFCERKRFC